MIDLTVERIARGLTTRALGRSLTLLPTTASTNDDARAAAERGAPHGHLVLADAQSRGRGSRGRDWVSPAGTDLYLSLVARLDLPPPSLPPLTLAIGLAAAEALEAHLPAPARPLVKWPNDLWVRDKKLLGVLVEGASLGERLAPLVIGIGINVNRRTFPDGLDVPATSLALERGAVVDRATVLAGLLNALEPWLERFVREGPEAVVEALNERLALRGESARCGDVVGVVERVAGSGALVLRTAHGPRACIAGTLRRHDG